MYPVAFCMFWEEKGVGKKKGVGVGENLPTPFSTHLLGSYSEIEGGT